jgi:hypothetical protein
MSALELVLKVIFFPAVVTVPDFGEAVIQLVHRSRLAAA